uniref:Putative secreted protein n=1 Tax=Ixodes ricinus TaxID=34613 RepID=A0A147BSW7_IXORI
MIPALGWLVLTVILFVRICLPIARVHVLTTFTGIAFLLVSRHFLAIRICHLIRWVRVCSAWTMGPHLIRAHHAEIGSQHSRSRPQHLRVRRSKLSKLRRSTHHEIGRSEHSVVRWTSHHPLVLRSWKHPVLGWTTHHPVVGRPAHHPMIWRTSHHPMIWWTPPHPVFRGTSHHPVFKISWPAHHPVLWRNV